MKGGASESKSTMENLSEFKNAILKNQSIEACLENCYRSFLNVTSLEESELFLGLLCLCKESPRVNEILKVLDLVRFPIKFQ